MAIILSSEDIKAIWDSETSKTRRSIFALRKEYFDGDQAILEEEDTRHDGATRNKVVTNWIKYVVRKHQGFVLGVPPTYSLEAEIEEDANQKTALVALKKKYKDNGVAAIDIEHFQNCVLFGESVEVHSVNNDSKIVITGYSPENWLFVYNEEKTLVVAIYMCVLPAGSVYRDILLEEDTELFTIYNEDEIVWYQVDPEDQTEWKVIRQEEHHYSRIPVVRHRVVPDYSSFITDAIITQQDVYNTVRSANADDIDYNVDSLLLLLGFEPDVLFERDTDGVQYIEKMRQERVLTLREDGDAKFITKGNDVDKVSSDLKITRDAIHLMAHLADIDAIVGTTGETSGIALKMRLQPQIDQASVFTTYFEKGLRDRIDLINVILVIRNEPQLLDYNVVFTLNIPIHEMEIWKNLPNIDHLLTMLDQLKLIPSIDDPQRSAEAKKKELENEALTLSGTVSEPNNNAVE